MGLHRKYWVHIFLHSHSRLRKELIFWRHFSEIFGRYLKWCWNTKWEPRSYHKMQYVTACNVSLNKFDTDLLSINTTTFFLCKWRLTLPLKQPIILTWSNPLHNHHQNQKQCVFCFGVPSLLILILSGEISLWSPTGINTMDDSFTHPA